MAPIKMTRSIFFVAALLLSLTTAAQQNQDKKLMFRFENKSLSSILVQIESTTDYSFFFNPAELNAVSVSFEGETTVEEFLKSALRDKKLYFLIDPSNNVFIRAYPFQDPIADRFYPSEKSEQENKPQEVQAPTTNERIVSRNTTRGNKLYEIGSKNKYVPGATVTLSGYIRTAEGPVMEGVSLQIEKLQKGVVTDNMGYYSINLPAGRHDLLIKSVGMADTRRTILLYTSGMLEIEMQEQVTNLQEVVIESDDVSPVKSSTMGVERLNMSEIKTVPTVFGEADVMRVVLTLPGVKSVGEASAGFNVRGGATDQNLILYNDATIYNPAHFFGFFSAFNPETVKEVELFKSLMPARYGGRLSSVLQVTGKEGNSEKVKGSAGIGLLTSRINLEGPLVKDKTTFLVGARTTYSGWIFDLLPEDSGYKNTKASFYDANMNINHKLNEHNEVSLTGYLSHDESNLNTDTMYYYDNRNISLKWNHEFNSKLASSISVGHDHYSYSNHFSTDSVYAYKMKFNLNQEVFKAKFFYTPGTRHAIEFGVNSTFYHISPGDLSGNHPLSKVIPIKIQKEQGLESALYIEDQFKLGNKISITAGLRYSVYNYLGPQQIRRYPDGIPRGPETIIDTLVYKKDKIIQTYHGLDYRASARFAITESLSVKAGYTTARQFVHMLSNTIAISPTDTWKLSDTNIKPQQSQQISVGVYKNLFSNVLEVSVEGYTKTISNYLDYKSGARLLSNPHIETEVFTTKGKAHGIEFMVRKTKGNFNGWMSYTYARTLLKMSDKIAGETINGGKYYPASYDKPHDFTFVGNHKLSRRFSISMNVTYSSGRPVTIPIGVFYYGDTQKTLYSNRNGYRIPDYFRTDLSLNIEGNHKVRQLTHNSWTIGVYNLTGRQNPYSVYFISENGVVKSYKLSIFGAVIPFINYNIRF
jgi:hypothetical protein